MTGSGPGGRLFLPATTTASAHVVFCESPRRTGGENKRRKGNVKREKSGNEKAPRRGKGGGDTRVTR